MQIQEIEFDMDGVLARFFSSTKAPFTGLFDRFNHKYDTNIQESEMIKPDVHSVFTETFANRMYDIFNAPNFYFELEPYEGAVETVNTIIDMGHECGILTSPANHFINVQVNGVEEQVRVINSHCAKGKIDWINKHIWRLGKHITITKKKYRFKAHKLVEDTTAQLDKWCPANPDGLGILIDQPWNRSWPNQPKNSVRVANIREVLNHI